MEAKPIEAMEASPKCPVCSLHTTKFKYFNNRNTRQPRYHCSKCDTKFTVGDFGRKKPQHYRKKRNQDPEEFKNQVIACSHCGEVGNSRFKYYNNKATCGLTQPRFKCLNGCCNKQFQMLWDGVTLVPNKKGKSKVEPHESMQAGDQPCILPIPAASASCSNDVMASYVQQGTMYYNTYNHNDSALYEVPAPMGEEQACDPSWNIYSYNHWASYEVCAPSMEPIQQDDPSCSAYDPNQASYELVSAPSMEPIQQGGPSCNIYSDNQAPYEVCAPIFMEQIQQGDPPCSTYYDPNQASYELVSAPIVGQGHLGQEQCDPAYCDTSSFDNQASYEVSAPIIEQGDELQYSYTQDMMDLLAFCENATTPACESDSLVGRDAGQAVDEIWNVEDVIRGIVDSASDDDLNAAASAWEVEGMNHDAQSMQTNHYAAARA